MQWAAAGVAVSLLAAARAPCAAPHVISQRPTAQALLTDDVSLYLSWPGQEHQFHHAVMRGYLEGEPQMLLATTDFGCAPGVGLGGWTAAGAGRPQSWLCSCTMKLLFRSIVTPGTAAWPRSMPCRCCALLAEVQQQQEGGQAADAGEQGQPATDAAEAAEEDGDGPLAYCREERRGALARLVDQPLLDKLLEVCAEFLWLGPKIEGA